MPDKRSLSSLLSRPFAALLLFGAVGIVAMVVTFSVARGVAARPAPVMVTQPPAAAAAAPATAPPVAPLPTADPATAPTVYPPPGNANGDGGGGGGD